MKSHISRSGTITADDVINFKGNHDEYLRGQGIEEINLHRAVGEQSRGLFTVRKTPKQLLQIFGHASHGSG